MDQATPVKNLPVELFDHVDWITKIHPVPETVAVVWPDRWRAFKGPHIIGSGTTAEEFYELFTENKPKARLGKIETEAKW